MNLTLDNLRTLICHKTQTSKQTKLIIAFLSNGMSMKYGANMLINDLNLVHRVHYYVNSVLVLQMHIAIVI